MMTSPGDAADGPTGPGPTATSTARGAPRRAAPGTLRVGILAGEASGDNLGAGLVRALEARVADVEFLGVGGPGMLAAGVRPLASMDVLQVNGFVEPIKRLPALLSLLLRLRRQLLDARVDVFVGVDFNVFNLLLERQLKRRGVPTVHYVSPSVYAWRRGRLKRIGRSADLVMTLYPFEPPLYEARGIRARFVGHPLADAIEMEDPGDRAKQAEREALGVAGDEPVLAVLPGSRLSEVRLMGDDFLRAALGFRVRFPKARIVVPCIRPAIRTMLEARIAEVAPDAGIVLSDGDARRALRACDVALVKSGTSTLEAMLLRRPMVVGYRLGPLTYRLVRRLLRTEFVALPNILAGEALVPELLQDAGTPDALTDALLRQLERAADGKLIDRFRAIHASLRQGADERAAAAVCELVEERCARV